MSDRYALIGNPVQHSLSPLIHRQFARQTQQDLDYSLIEAPLDGFEESVRRFIQEQGQGLNVTLPFKQEAWRLADHASERAKTAGAANTLVVEAEGRLYADNTDGAGLIADLQKHRCPIKNMDLLIVGAGGAVRGLLQPLWACKPGSMTISNRTPGKAQSIVADYPDYPIKVSALPHGLEDTRWSAIINATSASLYQQLPELPERVEIDCWAYDLVYARQTTPFMQWAQKRGAATVLDGSGMLVAQAAESFYLWRGVRPELEPALRALKQWTQGQ